jgi:hypothetical protein
MTDNDKYDKLVGIVDFWFARLKEDVKQVPNGPPDERLVAIKELMNTTDILRQCLLYAWQERKLNSVFKTTD